MSNVLLSLLVAVSAGTWVYTKFMRTTGGNNATALTAAAICAALLFVLMLTITSIIL
jgi:predicted ABC-type exoprotein transport system permease subunit